MSKTYNITVEEAETVISDIKSLNKKLVKAGLEVFRFSTKPSVKKDIKGDLVESVELTVENPVLDFNGWKTLARIDHAENMVDIRGDVDETEGKLIEGYRHDNTCDHCKKNIFRNYTYVLKNENTNEYTHIGSSCMTAFVKIRNVDAIWNKAGGIFSELNSYDEGFPIGGKPVYKIEDVLKATQKCLYNFGFVSKTEEEETKYANPSTYTRVTDYVETRNPEFLGEKEPEVEYTLKELVDFAKGDFEDTFYGAYDFMNNVKNTVLNENEYISERQIALLPILINTYTKYLKKKEAEGRTVDYKVGEKVKVAAKVTNIQKKWTEWGMSLKYTMDVDGVEFVCYTTSRKFQPERNEEITLECVIKNVYNGVVYVKIPNIVK